MKIPKVPVEDAVAAVFREVFEKSMAGRAEPLPSATEGRIRFILAGCDCEVAIYPCSDTAASVTIGARLGRVLKGYVLALRWLAANRAGNTVAAAMPPEATAEKELCVCASRITLPGDRRGLCAMLADFELELRRLNEGLGPWFPQMIDSELVARMLGSEDPKVIHTAAILADPASYLDWAHADPEVSLEAHGALPVSACRWLSRWDELLDWNRRWWDALPAADRSPDARHFHFINRALAEAGLGRFRAMLATTVEFAKAFPDGTDPQLATMRCRALHGLGRHADLLRSVQSSSFDHMPRIWFWRAVAHLETSELEPGIECYGRYESLVGTDILARRLIAPLLPKEDAGLP
jgi:hypothetical protein